MSNSVLGEATAVLSEFVSNLVQWYIHMGKVTFFFPSVRYHQNSKWLKFLCWFLVYASVSSWLVETYLNMWGISLLF